ncbi:MAG: hypothetical protein U0531_05575 [Dehalococcoidia bacterium]
MAVSFVSLREEEQPIDVSGDNREWLLERVTVRVANQDLARLLSLVGRIRFLNPDFDVAFAPVVERVRDSGAA